jgi:hypothetical protein
MAETPRMDAQTSVIPAQAGIQENSIVQLDFTSVLC